MLIPLYFRLLGAEMRSGMQYRVSFVAEVLGCFLVTCLDFIALFLLMTRFRTIGDWTLAEVAFLYGTSSISFSVAELAAGSFDFFDRLVVRGGFDRLLLRPLPIAFQLATGAFHVRRVGRLIQGLLALLYAFHLLQPAWAAGQWVFFAFMLLGGALFFLAIFITGAAAAFWTPQTSELTNMFTYGGQFMTSYPMHIYQDWLRSFFTFVVPMVFINFLPAVHLLAKGDPLGLPSWVPFLSPFVAVSALAVSLALFRLGVRYYQSTGS